MVPRNGTPSRRQGGRARTILFVAGFLALGTISKGRGETARGMSDDQVPSGRPPASEAPAVELKAPRVCRRGRARLGTTLAGLGVLLLIYVATVLLWRDPATDLYARWQQHQLAAELDSILAEQGSILSQTSPRSPDRGLPGGREDERLRDAQLAVAQAANQVHRRLKLGRPLGRIEIPRIGLKAVFVQGTRWGPDLSKGPGHYAQTSLPGVGRTMAIAGHRTTFGAPFRHLDSLKAGDRVRLQLPYATFHYRVFGHKVVDNDDWRILRDRGYDALVLSACHPLYSASRRWVVFARLMWVEPAGGAPYRITGPGSLRPV